MFLSDAASRLDRYDCRFIYGIDVPADVFQLSSWRVGDGGGVINRAWPIGEVPASVNYYRQSATGQAPKRD